MAYVQGTYPGLRRLPAVCPVSASPPYFHPSPAAWVMSALALFGPRLIADLFTQMAEDSSLQN